MSIDVVPFGGNFQTFTSSAGATSDASSDGTVDFPAAGWTDITSFSWKTNSGAIDNVVVELPVSVPVSTTAYSDSELPEEVDISALADGGYQLCVSARPAPPSIDAITFEVLNTLCSNPGDVRVLPERCVPRFLHGRPDWELHLQSGAADR